MEFVLQFIHKTRHGQPQIQKTTIEKTMVVYYLVSLNIQIFIYGDIL
jgi:hypothetical protein